MSYAIWNKIDNINGMDALYFINKYNIKTSDEVILILTKTGNVSSLLIKDKIIDNYNLDINLSVEEVAQKYLEIIEQQKQDQEKERLSLEEQAEKISILEAENKVLREGLQAVLRGDMQSLAYILYPEDFNSVNMLPLE